MKRNVKLTYTNAANEMLFDFAKAFDSIHQRFSLAKLGLWGKVTRWIRAFMTGRTKRDKGEEWGTQRSQVVPAVFLLFINNH